jgi:NAD(P)-dependent dehydrogenase (short-subunit alcohol dehydrogenase family)
VAISKTRRAYGKSINKSESNKTCKQLADSLAYAQSKLALIGWTHQLAQSHSSTSPVFVAVNPASFLGSKMVKEAYGCSGKSLSIGAEILLRAALDDEFAQHNGEYFDNDVGGFASPHPDALRADKNQLLVAALDEVLRAHGLSV